MIGAQIYPWSQHFAGRPASEWRAEALRSTAAAGASLWEDMLPASAAEVAALGRAIVAAGLRSETIYENGRLHDQTAGEVITGLVERMKAAADFGVKILVLNPMPLNWSSPEDKSDAQLRAQAKAMEELGSQLQGIGVALAFHTHHIEMRQAAREFHHTLLATDPEVVGLCLDAHWIYRGAGDSEVALHDIITLYGKRIRSFHLRQSSGGVWSELFGEGDIDYAAIQARLADLTGTAPLILEQAIEEGTPSTMSAEEALRRGVAGVKAVFGG